MQAKKIIFFLTLFISCLQTEGICQRDSIRVRVFDGTYTTPEPVFRDYNDKNYVRLNAYLALRGVFAIGYERVLHRKHALAVDAGLTYRDFIYEVFRDDEFDSDRTNVRIGNYLEVAYKFYPKSYYEFDGAIYLSPGFLTRSYNLTEDVSYYTSSQTLEKTVDVSYGMTDTFLRFGYVRESWAWDDVISDLYFGFGYRKMITHAYELTDASSGGQQIKPTQETKYLPCVYAGIKIGFVF